MKAKEILKDLKLNTFCRLKLSKIHGVGVFAIRPIPKGKNPFESSRTYKLTKIPIEKIKKLRPALKRYVLDFCAVRDGFVLVPIFGINQIDIAHYLNHSKNSNLDAQIQTNGDTEFYTKSAIKTGVELTVDYSLFSEF